MTMAMSDRDYAALVDAVQWVRQHSGTDAPQYSGLDNLCRVVDSIAKAPSSELQRLRSSARDAFAVAALGCTYSTGEMEERRHHRD